MKKILTVLAAAAIIATCAVSMTACSNAQPLKVKDIELTGEEYAFAIQKENTELLNNVNTYIAEWEADGSLDALINSYFDGKATFSYTNATAQPAEGDFVVATNAYFPPFESYNDNSAFVGVDIEIAYNIAQKLNKTLYVMDMDFDGIIPYIQSGKADIGMAGITKNPTREEQVSFATGYYTSAQVITVLESDTTFDACTSYDDVKAILDNKDKSYVI
ncbi:MAG: transporter substrate-binding domain-containing protein [Clostridia bacterium]|nr:transporter substrate-binding domain-containing protein [Clostridia bacterium]